jgi:two-component system, NtrC family, sensor kinase
MLEKAMQLCEAAFGGLGTWQGDRFGFTAARGVSQALAEFVNANAVSPGSRSGFARVARETGYVQFADISTSNFYVRGDPLIRAMVDLDGARTTLSVSLAKDEEVIGVLTFYRKEVRPFSDKQIALVQNFAEQAVIAMENARLLDDLRQRTDDLTEALEYQTATSDVLQVISRSTFNLMPVLETLSQTAARLCLAELSFMTRREGEAFKFVTAVGSTPETTRDAIRLKEHFLDTRSFALGRESITGRVLLQRASVQIIDVASDAEYTQTELITVGGIRTLLGVPMVRGDEIIGTMSLARQRVEPFTERQIELVRTFADQAVIAIENTRLLTELRESLEQQQAMARVLQEINSSPGELQPVFDVMLANAVRLCDCVIGGMFLYEDGGFRSVAMQNVTPEFAEIWRREAMRPAMSDDAALMNTGPRSSLRSQWTSRC